MEHGQQAAALAALCGLTCEKLCAQSTLQLGVAINRPLTLAHWRTLGTLARCNLMPALRKLIIVGSNHGDQGVALFAAGLRRGGQLPSLRSLALNSTQIGLEGATALASALTKRALPALESLHLATNFIGDQGLAALAPALHKLHRLMMLFLNDNQITDEGLDFLLGQPPKPGVLASMQVLFLQDNQITDEGCTALTVALKGAVLPELQQLNLDNNTASKRARHGQAVIQEITNRCGGFL